MKSPRKSVSLHWLWRELKATLTHRHLHYKTAIGAQKKNPSPTFMPWKKVPASAIIPTPGEVGQQICGVIDLGRAFYWVMEKEQQFLQAWGVQQQQHLTGSLWLCRNPAGTRIFFSFPGFCQEWSIGSAYHRAFHDWCLSSLCRFNYNQNGGLTNSTLALEEDMWVRTHITCVFPSHIPLTMPVRMHLDPSTHMLEMCSGTSALLHVPLPPSQCCCLPSYAACM